MQGSRVVHFTVLAPKDIGLFTYIHVGICYFPPFSAKSYKPTTTYPYTLIFIEFISYRSSQEVFMRGDFNACSDSHQGQDSHLDVNGINLLKLHRPQWLRESEDNDHHIAFG